MSTIKVDKIEKRTGSTLTLGGPCTAVTLACGSTQTGFGRTGTVDWCMTAKTSPLTVVSGNGYFINTTGGTITVTLPSSPSAGDIVAFKDYANTWDTNKVTVGRGGSKINGICEDATLNTESQSVTLIYVDGTKGWQDIHDSTSNVTGAAFISASGGNTTITCGNFKTHIFTGAGCFAVSAIAACAADNVVEYLVVAGGAGGGGGPAPAGGQGGGGAGGFRYFSAISPAGSPLVAPAGQTVTVQTYPIAVGAGGTAGTNSSPPAGNKGGTGGVSTFGSITSAGGGGGGTSSLDNPNFSGSSCGSGHCGASGGGSAYRNPGHPGFGGGLGNQPPVSPPQGQNGGASPTSTSPSHPGSGGGGAGAVGGNGGSPGGGAGGVGSYMADPFVGPTAPSYGTPGPVSSTRYFAGGGGGGGSPIPAAASGGGGTGGAKPAAGNAATTNTGGGGGGGGNEAGGTGGSGIVMIRYRFQ
jgi:hypothetical protein